MGGRGIGQGVGLVVVIMAAGQAWIAFLGGGFKRPQMAAIGLHALQQSDLGQLRAIPSDQIEGGVEQRPIGLALAGHVAGFDEAGENHFGDRRKGRGVDLRRRHQVKRQ